MIVQQHLKASHGDSSSAQTGQFGPLIAVDSSDGTLGSANVIKLGKTNVQFAGDTQLITEYLLVSETNTSNQTALIRLLQV